MPMDGLTLGAMARELNHLLEGGRVDRVQQTERDELMLTLRAQGKNHRLLLSSSPNNARIHLTAQNKRSPDTPPMFCMLLRKFLVNARFLGAEQLGADRVLTLRFEGLDELGDLTERRLIIEIMGRHSNLILTDHNGKILDSARHVTDDISRVREVLRDQMTYAETPAAAPEGEDPLAWFLTEGREGNAVQYASAAVEALRAHGIPARYCEGYLLTAADVRSAGGKTISLTGENAHAWCEAYFDGVGWLPVDVTPGFYYDALALQQLVSLPDSVHRTAAMEDTNDSAGEVSGTGENGDEKLRDLMHNAVHTAGILLGILAVLLVLLTLCILVFEGVLLLCRVHVFRTLKKASPEDRAHWTAWWGEKLLAARGIDASLGWHTDETDAKLASMIDSVNPGEYQRVCQLLEKAIYGGIELKSYEERTIRSLLERVRFAPMPDLTTRMRVHCLFLNHLRRCHRKK